jgi:predicted esterase
MMLRALAILALLAAPQGKPGGAVGGPGESRGELRDKQGPLLRVNMWVPKAAVPSPVKTLGLLLVFHGMNGNEGNYYGGTLECLRRLKLDEQYVMIAGKSKGPGWTLEDDGPIMKRVIEWAKEVYPVDPRRIYIWGSSNGAGFIGRFGWANQDLVAAAVGYCGGYNFQANPKPENPADTRLEWFFVHGGNDNPQNSGNAGKQLGALGYRYVFRQLDGYGHTDIWDGQGHPDMTVVNACRDDYMLWLHAIRHKTIELPKKDQEWLEKFEKPGTAESMLGSKAAFLNLQRIGGPQAGAAILLGLRAKSAGIRASAAESCAVMSYGKAVNDELVKLLEDENDRVQQSALRALGQAAVWHHPEAIEALCAKALPPPDGKKVDLAARLVAIDGLSRAAKPASLGNFEDKRLWWTLVRLLDDEDPKVRAMSFAALQPCVKDGFGYVPAKLPDQRKDASAKWVAWVTQKCGPEAQ